MLQAIVETVAENVLPVVGWLFLKVVTVGRYRGSGSEDTLVEGSLGLVVIIGVSYSAYRWWPL